MTPDSKRQEFVDSISQLLAQYSDLETDSSRSAETIQEITSRLNHLTELVESVQQQETRDHIAGQVEELKARIEALHESVQEQSQSQGSELFDQIRGIRDQLESPESPLLDQIAETRSTLSSQLDKLVDAQEKLLESTGQAATRSEIETFSQALESMKSDWQDSLANLNPTPVDYSADLSTLLEKVEALRSPESNPALKRLDELEYQLKSLQESLSKDDDEESLELIGISRLSGKLESLQKVFAESKGQADDSPTLKRLEELDGKLVALQNSLAKEEGDDESLELIGISRLANKIESLQKSFNESQRHSSGNDSTRRFDELESKLNALQEWVSSNELADKIEELQNRLGENSPGSLDESSVKGLEEKIAKLTGLVESGALGGDGSGEVNLTALQPLQDLSEKLEQTESRLQSLTDSIKPLVALLEKKGPTGGNIGDVEESDWEKQKRAILEGYAVDADSGESPSAGTDEGVDSEITTTKIALTDSEAKALANTEDPELIDLQERLEEKLRKAEIEISIERAKIHRQRRELEEKQDDLERQKAKINTSSSQQDDDDDNQKKEGSGRWSRFLGKS